MFHHSLMGMGSQSERNNIFHLGKMLKNVEKWAEKVKLTNLNSEYVLPLCSVSELEMVLTFEWCLGIRRH